MPYRPEPVPGVMGRVDAGDVCSAMDDNQTHAAVFLDRDGVINEERGYVHLPDEFILLPGFSPAC